MTPDARTFAAAVSDFDGIAYRLIAVARADHLIDPASAPEGRSHRDGQRALYLSLSPEGCRIATARYTDASGPAQAIYPLQISGARVVDLRDQAATARLGINTTHRAAEWQSLRAQGLPSPTWDIADRVRDLGLDGMLYASRSQPDLTHLTLLRWNSAETTAKITRNGAAIPA